MLDRIEATVRELRILTDGREMVQPPGCGVSVAALRRGNDASVHDAPGGGTIVNVSYPAGAPDGREP